MSIRVQNTKIAELLRRISNLYAVEFQMVSRQSGSAKTLEDLNRRKTSYFQAAQNVAEWPRKITPDLKIRVIPGVGKSTVEDIKQYLKTGEIIRLQELESEFGDVQNAMKVFTEIGGVGPKKAFDLVGSGYYTISDIPEAQQTTAMKLSIKHLASGVGRIPRKFIRNIQKTINLDCQWDITGSYRRGEPTSGDIDILIAGCTMETALKSLNWLIRDVIASGEKVTNGYTQEGYRVDIKIVPEESYWFALLHYTGSGSFNLKLRKHAKTLGLKLNEYGLYAKADKTHKFPSVWVPAEEFIFSALSLDYVAPVDRGSQAVLKILPDY